MIERGEKERMLRAHSIGPAMIRHLEEIGIERLSDLSGAAAVDLATRIDIALGRSHINRTGIAALQNLIDLAERKGAGAEPARNAGP
jgi:hypothetical protein